MAIPDESFIHHLYKNKTFIIIPSEPHLAIGTHKILQKCWTIKTREHICHDLAKWNVGKYHVTLSQRHNGVTEGHRWSRHRSQSQ